MRTPSRKNSVFAKYLVLLSIVLIFSAQNVLAATITAKAVQDKVSKKLVITGKTSGLAANALINVYDISNHSLIFQGQSDSKSQFSFLTVQDTLPCGLELQSGDTQAVIAVTGTNKSCLTQPVCYVVGGDRHVNVGQAQTFKINSKVDKKATIQYQWNFGDATTGTGATLSHTYQFPGQYLVQLTGSISTGNQCSDSVIVSVAPMSGTNPNPPLKAAVPEPAKASAMPTKDKVNDENAVVVFPFEEGGLQGGSQVNTPYNAMFPYNALNAQVIRKIKQKPQILDASSTQVMYSASSNPQDPAGVDSINTTSQNLFSDGAGSNFDPDETKKKASTTGETVYKENHDYTKARIAKTELWDKVRQPNASKVIPAVPEKGLSRVDGENPWVPVSPLTLPDQGLRGSSDLGKGVRAMPGIEAPYKENKPQQFDYVANNQSFVAQNIPITPIDDQGRTNPYPLMRVEARENGKTVAATDAVYTAASDTGCADCHLKGKMGADDSVWRTPVTIAELKNPDGTPGPATGKGAFPMPDDYPTSIDLTGDPIADFKKYGYGPAVHQTFVGDKFVLDPKAPMVAPGIKLSYDPNGVRKDRVAESRWLKPDGTTSPTNPDNDKTWKLQIRLKFKAASDYGEDNWQNREKAARWNNMLMHDYMTPINYNNARDDVFTEAVDDQLPNARNTTTRCASHHTSTLRYDTGTSSLSTITTLSQYTRTEHAFHGKMQVYKTDVAASEAPDHKTHKKGELIRDERGHPIMWGGRGWDSVHMDDEGMYLKKDAAGNYTVKSAIPVFAKRNNWDPVQFPKHSLAEEMLPVGEDIPMEKNCLTCHSGKTEKAYRDVHHAAGLKCDNCHGDMMAVGLVYPNEMYNVNRLTGGNLGEDKPTELTSADFRRQWFDEPDCGSCHVGDANYDKEGEAGLKHYFSAGALKQAWQDGDKSAASMTPVDARFAVMPTVDTLQEKVTVNGVTSYAPRPVSVALYRKSADVHGSGTQKLTCSSCHGGSHALWPNKDPNANDNKTSQQLQGYDGNVVECFTCHISEDFRTGKVATAGPRSVAQGYREGELVTPLVKGNAFLAGPHGMHPVSDEYWYKHADESGQATSKGAHNIKQNGGWHKDMAKKPGPDGEDQCAACHGADHKGTRLSRSLKERTLINEKGKSVLVKKDQVIGCDLCHTLAKSFTDVPKGSSKLHQPPAMAEIINGSAVGNTGGGHGH